MYSGPTIKNYQYGWICPKCGRVMSPSTPYCLFCDEATDDTFQPKKQKAQDGTYYTPMGVVTPTWVNYPNTKTNISD